MKNSYIYSKAFLEKGNLYNTKNLELLKDCFKLGIKYTNLKTGLLVCATTKNYVVLSYDFEEKCFIDEYNGKTIINNEKFYKEANLECKKINILNEYKIYIILNKKFCEDVDYYLGIISNLISDSFNISKKHSYCGDIVLEALDNVNDGITYCDKDECIRYANKACFEILKANKEEIVGKKIKDLTKGKSILVDVIKNKKSIIDIEYTMKYKGKNFMLTNSGYPVYSHDKELIGAIDIFRTIERSRKLVKNIVGYEAFFTFDDMIGENKKTVELKNIAKRFAKSNETIMILGESGTGKEIIAQSMHNCSSRKEGAFIALNCANFPNDLMDSELFGYDEGAFTGAKKGGKQGKFELANGGTLFLDEIGEMQTHLQAKLLRVLENMCIVRIGGNNQIKVDVRIIVATNRNLEKLVEEGKFRRDLYYRLKVLCIKIPPLRERKEDVILLAEHFIKKTSKKFNDEEVIITDKAKDVLMNYKWPGNIRELENLISRVLFILDGKEITEDILIKAGIKETEYDEIIKRQKVKLSKEIIEDTLFQEKGNKKRTSERLGISRPTLYKLMKKYNVK